MTKQVDIELPHEVFVLVEDPEHAHEVMAQSDPVAQRRAEYIKARGGDVPEEELPDVAVALDTAASEIRARKRRADAVSRAVGAAPFKNGIVYGNEATAKVGTICLRQNGLFGVDLSFDGQPVPLTGIRRLALVLEVAQLPKLEIEYYPQPAEEKK